MTTSHPPESPKGSGRPSRSVIDNVKKKLQLIESIRSMDREAVRQHMSAGDRRAFEDAIDDMDLEAAAWMLGVAKEKATSDSQPGDTQVDLCDVPAMEGAACHRFKTSDHPMALRVVGEERKVESAQECLSLSSGPISGLTTRVGEFSNSAPHDVALRSLRAREAVIVLIRGKVDVVLGADTPHEQTFSLEANGSIAKVLRIAADEQIASAITLRCADDRPTCGLWALFHPSGPEIAISAQLLDGFDISKTYVAEAEAAIGVDAVRFAEKLPPAKNDKDYSHSQAIKDGRFARRTLAWRPLTKCTEAPAGSSNFHVLTNASPKPKGKAKSGRPADTELDYHTGIELMITLSGGFWTWRSKDRDPHSEHATNKCITPLSPDRKHDQRYDHGYITANGEADDFAADVLLMDPDVKHSIAAYAAVDSALLHMSFDPLPIRAKAASSEVADFRTFAKGKMKNGRGAT
ncbi:MAG: hypothetical protein Q8R02_08755 [Hyphomonadaceae bacterium]|nr:hypothetical protein [Hyphomonadaceae bacterium]